MAYTNAWNETTPLGTADANTIDDIFRSSKVDLRERLNSILGVAIGTALADPVVASGSSLATLRSELTTIQGNALLVE